MAVVALSSAGSGFSAAGARAAAITRGRLAAIESKRVFMVQNLNFDVAIIQRLSWKISGRLVVQVIRISRTARCSICSTGGKFLTGGGNRAMQDGWVQKGEPELANFPVGILNDDLAGFWAKMFYLIISPFPRRLPGRRGQPKMSCRSSPYKCRIGVGAGGIATGNMLGRCLLFHHCQ